jgi:ribA/ribD-fused uncharacterized protein
MKQIDDFHGQNYFLSNFYPISIVFEGQRFDSIEHAFQAAKTLSLEERKAFQRPGMSPGQSKRLGRQVTLRSDWESVKTSIMLELLTYKFSDVYAPMQGRLLDTGSAVLVEGNYHHDNFWGDCYCNAGGPATREVKAACKPEGKNWLGQLLMVVREQLQAKRAQTDQYRTEA